MNVQHEDSYHYGVMRRAIDLIDTGEPGQSLGDLAAQMQMSPAHFQRVFSQWVGISPKKYQQYLSLGQAKELLDSRFTTLGTAQEVGLSGGGRLHDLFLRWEAMSPGDYARKGAGLTLRYGYFDSPFGDALVMGTGHGICGIGFTSETGREAALADLCGRWPDAAFVEDPETLQDWAEAAFGLTSKDDPVPLYLIGAPFQIKVWEALLQVPSGHVTSYSEIAQAIGNPRAVRAVGTAVGRNPISYLIPCHRALRKSGGLGGYHWGLPVKRAMLAWESARAEAKQQSSGSPVLARKPLRNLAYRRTPSRPYFNADASVTLPAIATVALRYKETGHGQDCADHRGILWNRKRIRQIPRRQGWRCHLDRAAC